MSGSIAATAPAGSRALGGSGGRRKQSRASGPRSVRPRARGSAVETNKAARYTATEIAIDIGAPEPITPGVPVTLRFSLKPQPVVLKPGERLVLDIASRIDLQRSDVSHGHAQFDMQVPPYYARSTLHYGPDTFIELLRTGQG